MNNHLPIHIRVPDHFFDEEERCGYRVSADMKRVWAVELDLLSEVDRVCKKHKIQYMACGGTLLGAVRHHGYIPWDDDIDVMMTWDHYKKFCEVGPGEFSSPYFFQNGFTDKGSARGHVQIRNSNTTAILKNEKNKKYQFNQGIFIDVFCLDHIPDNQNEKAAYLTNIKKRRSELIRIERFTCRYSNTVRSESGRLKRCIKDVIGFFMKLFKYEERAYKKFEDSMHKYNNINTEQAGLVFHSSVWEKCFWSSKDVNSPLLDVPFEFLLIPVPSNYDAILRKHYGNWKEFVIGENTHGDLFVDPNRPYSEYVC